MIFTKGSTVTVAPTSEPLATQEAKDWLKVEVSTDDTLIDALVTATREYIEASTGLALFTQTVAENLDDWPDVVEVSNPNAEFHLLRYPVQSVTSITYIDGDGATQTLDSSKYIVDTKSKPCRIAMKQGESYPSLRRQINAITVTYVAGWSTVADIPETLKTAMRLMLTHFYERRADSASTFKTVADKLIEKHYLPVL